MDIISGLSDDLLLKILSFLPTEIAISTSILSKRWKFLWLWLPKLKYHNTSGGSSKDESLRRFLNRNLPLHRAPVIESFHLELFWLRPEDIKPWVETALSRNLRELEINNYHSYKKPDILPRSLYSCKSLVILKLGGRIRLHAPCTVCLPSLKTLQLYIVGLDGESLGQLLSICPVLENLEVLFHDNVRKISVIVPSLQSLSLSTDFKKTIDELEIATPCLKYLRLGYRNKEKHPFSIENMPKLEEAFLDVRFLPADFESLMRSITSVKRLTLCSKASYGNSFVFNQLEHLKLCYCKDCSSDLLARLLKDFPNLRVLDIFTMVYHYSSGDMDGWNIPTSVPEYVLSKLQTFRWSRYLGGPEERDVAVYIFKNSPCLKTATISYMMQSFGGGLIKTATFSQVETFVPNYDMNKVNELSRSPREIVTCQLIFN